MKQFSNESLDQIFYKYPGSLLECAHIYNVKDIDLNIDGEFLTNPNNGIMMNPTMHKAFDKDYFSFNLNGDLVFDPKIDLKFKLIILEGKQNINISHLFEKFPRMKYFIEKRNEKLNWI
jgi:hypothetical protein